MQTTSQEFKCPYSEDCDINSVSRRFCQKCRLRKCFSVGMKKEWILNEEQLRRRWEIPFLLRSHKGNRPDDYRWIKTYWMRTYFFSIVVFSHNLKISQTEHKMIFIGSHRVVSHPIILPSALPPRVSYSLINPNQICLQEELSSQQHGQSATSKRSHQSGETIEWPPLPFQLSMPRFKPFQNPHDPSMKNLSSPVSVLTSPQMSVSHFPLLPLSSALSFVSPSIYPFLLSRISTYLPYPQPTPTPPYRTLHPSVAFSTVSSRWSLNGSNRFSSIRHNLRLLPPFTHWFIQFWLSTGTESRWSIGRNRTPFIHWFGMIYPPLYHLSPRCTVSSIDNWLNTVMISSPFQYDSALLLQQRLQLAQARQAAMQSMGSPQSMLQLSQAAAAANRGVTVDPLRGRVRYSYCSELRLSITILLPYSLRWWCRLMSINHWCKWLNRLISLRWDWMEIREVPTTNPTYSHRQWTWPLLSMVSSTPLGVTKEEWDGEGIDL